MEKKLLAIIQLIKNSQTPRDNKAIEYFLKISENKLG